MKRKKGFSLLELMLVLGIASAVSFMKFQDLKHEQEDIQAKSVGEQIKQVGEAVNGYISIHYDKLSTLSNSKSESTDPGPRTCSGSLCTITYQTLVNEGLLPDTFSGINANKSPYTIQLKREGTSPNYVINGLVTTNNTWVEGDKVRYDLLGKAMQAAGVDSGMSKSSSSMSGYSGSWDEQSSDFPNINKSGLLGYRVGYDSSMYSVYLRRDGTLPMTGDLDMGGNSINNVQDITAAGTTTSGTLKSTGDTNVGGNLSVARTGAFTGNIGVRGMSPNNQPSGFLGGVVSPDYYAQAGIYIAKNGTNIPDKNWAFQANRDGYLAISGNMNAGGSLTAGGNIYAGHEVRARNGSGDSLWLGGGDGNGDYELRMDSNIPLTIWQTKQEKRSKVILSVWGTTQINGDVNVNAAGDTTGGITASGNISGDTLQTTSINNIGTYCDSSGKISKTSSGILLSCYQGTWQESGVRVGSITMWGTSVVPDGYLELNGQGFNKNTYPLLARLYPNGVLPDFRGYFVRAWDHNRGIDSDSGRGLLSTQEDAIRNITARFKMETDGQTNYFDGAIQNTNQEVPGHNAEPDGKIDEVISFDASRVVPTAPENRPKNIAVMYIIKAG